MSHQDLPRPVERLVEEPLDLVVHHLGGALGDLAPLANLAAQEDLLLLVAHGHHADALAHAELGHHAARDVGGPLDVVAGAGRDLVGAEHQLFGRPGRRSRWPAGR